MSRTKEIYEHLVHQTVHSMLFHELNRDKQAPARIPEVVNTCKEATNAEIHEDLILYKLIGAGDENPAEDDEDNNGNEARRCSWVVECPNWPIERLRREKAAIKRYIHAQRQKLANGCRKTLSSEVWVVYEAYALLKLFLLERDPNYRHCLQQSFSCTNSFLTSLHVLLTLYATYFERAHGRQISEKSDVKPIETVYEFFLTHQQQLTA